MAPQVVLKKIAELNSDASVHGILVQLPLPPQFNEQEILEAIAPEKDVDGLHPASLFDAATPIAIGGLLAGYNVELSGRRVAIVGRGRLVGAPLERMWRASGVDVTTFEKGDDLSELIGYDVIVTATGVPGVITSEMVHAGAVVVDAGTAPCICELFKNLLAISESVISLMMHFLAPMRFIFPM